MLTRVMPAVTLPDFKPGLSNVTLLVHKHVYHLHVCVVLQTVILVKKYSSYYYLNCQSDRLGVKL